jgi:C_GCAxxG_C_C family probable redox protein
MKRMHESCMTRRKILKNAGRFSAALVATGGIPSILANAAEVGSDASIDLKDRYDRRCLLTVLRMGHCAPSVMDTLVDNKKEYYEYIVKLTSGLPGGIGNSGAECGGVTSPIMFLGLELTPETKGQNLLDLVILGQRYMNRFRDHHGTIFCSEIQTPDGGISPCLRAMCSSRKLVEKIMNSDMNMLRSEIGKNTLKSYDRLLKSFQKQDFHCAHSVFNKLSDVIDVNEILLGASRGFVGGTLLQAHTCSALTAGVLAIGSKIGEIEDSYIRVSIMMGKMMTGGDAMENDVNRFNRAINVGNELAVWFENRFGSTKCGDIAKIDFSNNDSVKKYLSSNKIESCRGISHEVAKKVREIFDNLDS